MRQLTYQPVHPGLRRFHAWFVSFHPIYAALAVVAAVLGVVAAIYPVAVALDAWFGIWIHLPEFEFRRWPFVFLAVVISPLLETLVFQYAVFRVAYLSNRFRQAGWWLVALSAFFFGVQHFYSAGYILIATFAGFAFSGGFLMAGTFKRGFWIITAAHAAVNGVALAIKWIR